MANLPIFAAGTYDSIQPAIDKKILTYPAFVYVSDLTRLAFIDKDLEIQLIKGDPSEGTDKEIKWVDELPSPEEAEEEVLYVYDGLIYTFNGEEIVPAYIDYTDDIEALQADFSELSETVGELSETVDTLETTVDDLQEEVKEIEEGSTGLVFSPVDEFPEEGDPEKLYIDKSEDDPAIYAYDDELEKYIKVSGSGSELQFIELDSYEPDSVTAYSLDEIDAAMEDDSVKEIILGTDIECDSPMGICLTNGGEKTVDLNGYNVNGISDYTDSSSAAFYVSDGTLTIEGDGAVYGGSGSASNVTVWAVGEDAKIIINGGSYTVGVDADGDGNSTIYSADGAYIEIHDGYFDNDSHGDTTGSKRYVLNVRNNVGASISCYGGTYVDQNPADGDDKDTTTGATFLAEGCKVTEMEQDNHTLYIVTEE